jgi:hypothetical protein
MPFSKKVLMMKKEITTLFLSILFLATACTLNKDRLKVDVSGIIIPELKIHRYDLDLFKVSLDDLSTGLQTIQHKYYFFLGTNLSDPSKLAEMRAYLTNPRNIEFQKAVEIKYKDLSATERQLIGLFQHYKYYFPGRKIPRIYTYISGGDYENPVQLADSVLIIALDDYLGKEFKPYLSDGLPLYKAERMTTEHIVPDVANEMVNALYTPDPSMMTLLDRMIGAGKMLYLIRALLPETTEELILDYSPKQDEWIRKNEAHVWAAIIENRMLFSGSSDILRMFFADGPCTPDFTTDSPPRLGEWIGLQVVTSFMQKNPDIKIPELMEMKDPQNILTLSGYKPEK